MELVYKKKSNDSTYDNTIWKSYISGIIEWKFFQAVAVSVLLYGCTTWTLRKHLKKKLDRNDARMLCAVLEKFWKQHPTKHGHLASNSQTIQIRQAIHAEYCWWGKGKLISDNLLCTPTHGHTSRDQSAKAYIYQQALDTIYRTYQV